MQPKSRISQLFPTKPSEVQTMPYRLGKNTRETIFRSMKLEWFIRIRQGSFLPIFSMPCFWKVNLAGQRSKMARMRITICKRNNGRRGFLRLGRLAAITSS